MESKENNKANSRKNGDLKQEKRETGTSKSGKTAKRGKKQKRRSSILASGWFPASPASILRMLESDGVRRSRVVDEGVTRSINQLVNLARDAEHKKRRSNEVPWLREDPKSFEVTTEETRQWLNRIPLKAGHASGKDSSTLMALLERQGHVRVLRKHSNRPPKRGTVYAFNCKRFKEYEFEVEEGFLERAKQTKEALIEARKTNPYVEIYAANLERYSLAEEHIELLPYYVGLDAEGEPKFYGDQYARLKNWDGSCTAKQGSYHSVYSVLPDVLRVRRRDENGVYLALVDVSSAFAVFIYKLLKEEIKRDMPNGRSSKREAYELGQFGKDIELGRLYDKFEKMPFLSLLNAYEGLEKLEPVVEALEKEYPLIAQRVRNLKRRNKQKLWHLLNTEQTELMEEAVMQCKKWGFDAMILGDELDVPEHEAERVKDLLLYLIQKNTGLEAKVKIVTRAPHGVFVTPYYYKSKSPCPEGHCPCCWEEKKAVRLASPYHCSHSIAREVAA